MIAAKTADCKIPVDELTDRPGPVTSCLGCRSLPLVNLLSRRDLRSARGQHPTTSAADLFRPAVRGLATARGLGA